MKAELLGIFFGGIYIAKCGSSSCLKDTSFFFSLRLVLAFVNDVRCTFQAGQFSCSRD